MAKATLDFFIPEDRRQALLKGETLPIHSHGAVLFADLSGFTKLTSDLTAQLGPQRGAEELTRQLDPIYTELIRTIHNYRGSVIDISGDGLTCWFDSDNGYRATSCAVLMQRIMKRYEKISVSSIYSFSLGIKIAISVGPVQRFLVGDPNIQLLEALAGRELLRVVKAQEQINRGEIAIYDEVVQEIKEKLQNISWMQTEDGEKFAVIEDLTELAPPLPWPSTQNLKIDIAQKWVFRPIYERIESGKIEFLTELRQAVPMFVKFSGIDYDQDELAEQKLDQFIRCVQDILSRYEGYLCNLTIGDKGSNLYISFGAPIAHEDSINRALAAALRIKSEVEELSFIEEIQVGLTHGPVWAGAHGGQMARTYSIIGAEVNLAARLMSHAKPGQILVSPHVAELAPNYTFLQLSAIGFKGIEKPMSPFLLVGRGKAHFESSPKSIFLGREIERSILEEKLLEVLDSNKSAGTVIVEGEAGIGKSRLLSFFSEQATEHNLRVLQGQADPVEITTQYFAVKSILGALFEISEIDDQISIQNKILSVLQNDEFLLNRAPLLNDVFPAGWMDNELTSQMQGEARATSTREMLLHILKNVLAQGSNSTPLVLLFDDAQWLDAATWTLLGYINRELPSILLVIATRPITRDEVTAQIMDEFKRILDNTNTQYIHLASLSPQDTTDLVSRKLGVKHIPASILEFIQARAQGNPFFSEEIAYALRDSRIINIQNDMVLLEHTAEELARIDFPETIQGVITRRIDRLPAPHQLTLKVASVIGRIFILNMLANIHPAKVEKNILEEYLQNLTTQGITDLESPDPELTYLFKHVIFQEVIYSLMTFSQRKQLHCAIAEWYEKNYADDLTPHYSRLAYHWLKGETNTKAIYFLEKSAEQSLKLYANEDVIYFLTTAFDLDKVDERHHSREKSFQHAHWERMLGTAYLRIGKLNEAEAHLTQALKLLGNPPPKNGIEAIGYLSKELIVQIFHRMFPSRHNRRRLPARKLRIEEEVARIEIEDIFYYAQNTTLLAWSMLRKLNIAERIEIPELITEGYGNLQMISGLAKQERVYQMYKDLGQALLLKSSNIPGEIFVSLREGVVRFTQCDWELAYKNLERGIQLADQIGDRRKWIEMSASLATSLHLQGQFNKSLECWQEQYQRASRSDGPQNQAWGLYGLGHNQLMLGDTNEAIRLIEASINIPMKNADDKILNTSRFGALSLAYQRAGNNELALENILAHQRHSPAKPGLSSTMHEYGPVCDATINIWKDIQVGQFQTTASQKRALELIFHKIPIITKALNLLAINKARCNLYNGIYLNLTGRIKSAEVEFRKCIELAERHRQPYDLGRAHYELGLILNGQTGRDHLIKAYKFFEETKTPYEKELAKIALETQ